MPRDHVIVRGVIWPPYRLQRLALVVEERVGMDVGNLPLVVSVTITLLRGIRTIA